MQEFIMAAVTPSIAARPFWISMLSLRSCSSGSSIWEEKGYPPGMVPEDPSYPPGRSWGPPVYLLADIATVSSKAPKRAICTEPVNY